MKYCWVLLLMLVATLSAQAADTLRILTWPGYADADLVSRFESEHHVKVEVTQVASDEVLWQKLTTNGGRDFDVFAANTAEMQRYIGEGVVRALTPALIPNIANQLPRFHPQGDMPGVVQQGLRYAVPYTYAEMGLIYDRRRFAEPPQSWRVLWDPQWRGKVLMFDGGTHAFSLAAMAAGLPPFKIPAADFARLARSLVELRRNLLTFYATPEQALALFRDDDAALLFANFGSQQLKLMRDAGLDVGYTIPAEGALAWLDCWAVTAASNNAELAQAWINYTLEPEVSAALSERQGLANTIAANGTASADDHLLWLQTAEDPERRNALWNRVLSGDRPELFRQ